MLEKCPKEHQQFKIAASQGIWAVFYQQVISVTYVDLLAVWQQQMQKDRKIFFYFPMIEINVS